MLAYLLAVLAGVVAGFAYRGLGGVAALALGVAIVITAMYAPAWPGASAQVARIGRSRFSQALIGFALGAFSVVLVLDVREASTPVEVFAPMIGFMIGFGWALHCVRRRVS